MNDRLNDSAHTAAPASNAHLLSDFLSLHQKSGGRSNQDVQDCRDAQKTDRATLDLLSSPSPDKAKLTELLQRDIQQDKLAAGVGKKEGTDQKNADLDVKVITADAKLLASAPNLSEAQRKVLLNDVSTHDHDNLYSRDDISAEQGYIKHDQDLLTALKTGKGLDKAINAVAGDREQDIIMEDIYAKNDTAMKASNQAVLNTFGKHQPR